MFVKEVADVTARFIRLCGERDMLIQERNEILAEIHSIGSEIETLQKVLIFLQNISTASREIAKREIETIVTNALQYVFGTTYEFKINLRTQNSRPEADFMVVTKHGERIIESMPTLSKGGGITDLLSVALKFALLELLDYDGPMWLDEPFKQISEKFVPAAGKLLTFMGETSGRQINIITHNPKLVDLCDTVFKVTQQNGQSRIQLLSRS